MNESLTLQLGQCGNQIGNEFWKKITKEHENAEGDRKDKYFYTTGEGVLIPRTVLIDTEPRAISQAISTMGNTFLTNEGTGAGNNWAHGFYLAKNHKESLLETIARNAEACDSLESFQVIHSTAGGTGSGFSSFLAEELIDAYPKKIFTSFSILPNNNEASDVVVQPYNTVLSLNKLNEHFDNVILMDNFALSKQIIDSSKTVPSYESLNSIAADIISSYSASVRFPSYLYCDHRSILNTLVPIKDVKMIIPSFVNNTSKRFSMGEIMNNLIKHKSMLCDYEPSNLSGYFSILNILENTEDVKAVLRMHYMLQPKINFLDLSYYMCYIAKKSSVNVSMNNTSSTKFILKKICGQFDCLRKRQAFLEMYKKFGLEISDMDVAKENLLNQINCYETFEVK
ncbi:hypothetical protein NUSPORA_00604 [Nucleospora cyclopteri]